MPGSLKGVIAAIITPVDDRGRPDHDRLISRAEYLLDHGCDALNLLGTTGEATSLSAEQRLGVMNAVAGSGLPMHRFMVGTGAAAVADAVTLSQCAAHLGFAAALVLPPFYYKPITDEGLTRYIGAVVEATTDVELPIFLYNFPAQSGIAYTPEIVGNLLAEFGSRIGGLKDSSGDIDYAEQIAALSSSLRVFPSNEAVLLRARAGDFAGCISATANINHEDCALAYHSGDEKALERANTVRAAFAGLPLVPGIKETLARKFDDPFLATLVPPLAPLTAEQSVELKTRLDAAVSNMTSSNG